MTNDEKIRQFLESQINRLYELKEELNSKNDELDQIFKRRTEIHEGASATKEEVQELDAQFLKCADDIHKIGDEINEIQDTVNNILEGLEKD